MLSDEHQASQAEKIRCSFRSDDGAQCDWLEGDALRIKVGGYVIVKSLRGWHGLETTTRAIESRARADALASVLATQRDSSEDHIYQRIRDLKND